MTWTCVHTRTDIIDMMAWAHAMGAHPSRVFGPGCDLAGFYAWFESAADKTKDYEWAQKFRATPEFDVFMSEIRQKWRDHECKQ